MKVSVTVRVCAVCTSIPSKRSRSVSAATGRLTDAGVTLAPDEQTVTLVTDDNSVSCEPARGELDDGAVDIHDVARSDSYSRRALEDEDALTRGRVGVVVGVLLLDVEALEAGAALIVADDDTLDRDD